MELAGQVLGFLSQLLSLGDRLLDPADHVEGRFGKVVVFAVDDRLERADRVLDLDELAGDASEHFGDVERLRQEALDLPRAADGQLILFAEVFTGIPGKFVPIEDTVRSFKAVVNGEYDHLPEAAFYMVGSIEEAVEKAQKLAEAA